MGREKWSALKVTNANDHYQRAIKRAGKAKDQSLSRKDRRANASLAAHQYDKAVSNEKEIKSIEKKFNKLGVQTSRNQAQLKAQKEAGELFVKKTLAQRTVEDLSDKVYVGMQFALQTAVLGRPTMAIGTDYSAYKLKNR